MVQHFPHMGSGLNDGLRTNSLCDQVSTRVLGQYHIDVTEMIEHFAVEFLGNALIKTTVTSLHVEDRDLPPLRGDYRQTGVCIAVKKNGIGLLHLEHRIGLADDLGNCLRCGFTRGTQEVIRLTNLQVLEEDLV